jgi:polycomb protein EED
LLSSGVDRYASLFAPEPSQTESAKAIVCRPEKKERTYSIEEIRRFEDEDDKLDLNTLAWSVHPETGDPLLCVSGSTPTIKIYNVVTGLLERVLFRQGKLINDLCVSPLNPHVLFSAGEDGELRAWNLWPKYCKFPSGAVFVGEGNKGQIVSIDVHHTCRYVLTGGEDAAVNLWVVPKNIAALPTMPAAQGEREGVTRVHYPHFKSSEIHGDNVDCIKFYGDLILSRGVREKKIMLWKIDNFSSEHEPPEEPPANVSIKERTRSAFGGGFQILLSFAADKCAFSYVRFNLFYELGMSPILMQGNEKGELYCWNLDALGVGDPKPKGGKAKGKGIDLSDYRRETSTTSFSTSDLVPVAGSFNKAFVRKNFRRDHPFINLMPHETVKPRTQSGTAVRGISWSNCGRWCVAAMDKGIVCLYSRWD